MTQIDRESVEYLAAGYRAEATAAKHDRRRCSRDMRAAMTADTLLALLAALDAEKARVAAALREAADIAGAAYGCDVDPTQSILSLIPDAGAALDRAGAEADARVAAAWDAAASIADEYEAHGSGGAGDAIRMKATLSETLALDRALREAEARGMERAVSIARDCIYYDSAGIGFEEERFEAAIRAQEGQ